MGHACGGICIANTSHSLTKPANPSAQAREGWCPEPDAGVEVSLTTDTRASTFALVMIASCSTWVQAGQTTAPQPGPEFAQRIAPFGQLVDMPRA